MKRLWLRCRLFSRSHERVKRYWYSALRYWQQYQYVVARNWSNTRFLTVLLGKLGVQKVYAHEDDKSSSPWLVNVVTGKDTKWDIDRHVNSQWWAIARIDLQGDTVTERTNSLLKHYGRVNTQQRHDLALKYWYKTEFLVCLAQAETWLWWEKKTKHNYFNCGNNDRWDTITFSSLERSINWLHNICLNWTYMKHKFNFAHLNPNHKDSPCQNNSSYECKYSYATSKENRSNNMRNCLSNIHGKNIDFTYEFRL